MKQILLVLFWCLIATVEAKAQAGEIFGQVLDEHGDPMVNVQVSVTREGKLAGAVITDFDGMFHMKPLNAGFYNASFVFPGYRRDSVIGIPVVASEVTRVDSKLGILRGYLSPLTTTIDTLVAYRVYLSSQVNALDAHHHECVSQPIACPSNRPGPWQPLEKIQTVADIQRYDLLGKCGVYLYSR
jgi:hypothetical protein